MDPSKNPTGGGGGSRRTVDHDEVIHVLKKILLIDFLK